MNRYNFNDHQIKELQKLYPNIRIPFNEHFDYYIDLQLESDPDIQKILGDLIYISFTMSIFWKTTFNAFQSNFL